MKICLGRITPSTTLAFILSGVLPTVFTASVGAAPADYFPFTVGNRWVYESSEGSKEAPALESWEVIRQEGKVFVMHIQQPFVTLGGLEEVFEPVADGVQRRAQDAPPADATLILKLPLTAGSSWEGADGGRYAVTAVGETVTVPAGTFTNCVEVTRWHKKTSTTVISTYASGVGMVQREEKFPLFGGLGGGGDFEFAAQGRAVLRLKEWQVKSQKAKVKGQRAKGKKLKIDPDFTLKTLPFPPSIHGDQRADH
jgi:hypothetical protein